MPRGMGNELELETCGYPRYQGENRRCGMRIQTKAEAALVGQTRFRKSVENRGIEELETARKIIRPFRAERKFVGYICKGAKIK